MNNETTTTRELTKVQKHANGALDSITNGRNAFGVRVGKPNVFTRNGKTFDISIKTCTLHQGYNTSGDGIWWALDACSIIAAHWSDEQLANKKRIKEEAPVEDGDIVMIEGDKYKVRIDINPFDKSRGEIMFDKVEG